ncbi:hypothetical protein DPMN_160789 [Dreissena polymorpha]|uniref:Uncharacterized protein n=1 Tax=Dreissena polymorpha TaxID=45954 RepID=A0A9D4ISW1_DREPO|nr:hypothetical protein DPMN_160789 [Dreissena polymorpha]
MLGTKKKLGNGEVGPVDVSINLKEDGNQAAISFINGCGWAMLTCMVEIDRVVIRYVKAGRPRVVNGAMHNQYQFEVNRCINEEVNFQGSSANSVEGDSGQDGRTDGGYNF